MLQMTAVRLTERGYPSQLGRHSEAKQITTDEYAADQGAHHPQVVAKFLAPLLSRLGARTVLDVGCGIGGMVQSLIDGGIDAYGVDLADVEPRWAGLGRPRDRFAVVDPAAFKLPFHDGEIDFVYSFGAIEHVGTANGHSDRLSNYHDIRRQWVQELLRVVRPGGHLLLGGPNRAFPVDVAHGPDSRANGLELWLHRRSGVSIHRIWGEHFLWSFGDLARYVGGTPCRIEPLRVTGLIEFGRVPGPLRALVRAYVRFLPRALLETGFNPWMLALIQRGD